MHNFMYFLVLQSSRRKREKRAVCFAFIVFLMSCCCKYPVALPHGPCVGLRFVIAVYPDHSHLPLYKV